MYINCTSMYKIKYFGQLSQLALVEYSPIKIENTTVVAGKFYKF